jgi:hypothetical protein
MSARLYSALARDPKIQFGPLLAPTRRHMQPERETLEHLLLLTFLTQCSLRWWRSLPLTTAPNVWTGGWLQVLSLIGEWNGQFILLPHKNVQEWMGHSWPCRKKERGLLSLTWSRSCMPAWQLTTSIWRQVEVVYI